MKVLFFMRNFSGYFRQFEPALRELLDRGHRVHVARDRNDTMDGHRWAGELLGSYGDLFSFDFTPHPQLDPWYMLKRQARLSRDYLHFLGPEFRDAPAFVARAEKRAPDGVVRAFAPVRRVQPVVDAAQSVLYAVEDASPETRAVQEYIAGHDPHIVLLGPHLMPGSQQTEYLRAASAMGLRTGLCVASWDNLSSKQIVRVDPDVVTVWNETQLTEAVEIHGLPRDRIAVTGAQVYDHWFDWNARPREEFMRRVGLDVDRPFLLYAGGALFPAEITEAQFARQWLERLRACSDPVLADIQVLVRPHPKRFEEWRATGVEDCEGVALWPREGMMPVAEEAKADFYDSIYHSACVVGVNTSAMLEAGIVGRRVHAMLAPEFSGSQLGTIHFHYLTDVGGGLLRLSRGYEEHFAHLGEAIRESRDGENPNREFIEAFIRPQGIDKPSAPLFADAIERAASLGPARPPRRRLASRALTVALAPLASRMRGTDLADYHRKMTSLGTTAEESRVSKSERSTQAALDAHRKSLRAARGAKGKERMDQAAKKAEATNGADPIDVARSRARSLAASDKPIVAEPFADDATAELLFWIPYLTWLVNEHPGIGERLTIIGPPSREGWYGHLGATWQEGGSGVELPPEVERISPATVDAIVTHLKQRKVLAKPKRKSVFRYQRMAPPKLAALDGSMPENYIAIDLAFDRSLPERQPNVELVSSVLDQLPEDRPLVLLRPLPIALPTANVLVPHDDPSLAGIPQLEAAVVAGAERLIGTVGSMCYLAPFFGVPSLGIFDAESQVDPQELRLATRVLDDDGLGGFRAVAAGDEGLAEASASEDPTEVAT